MDSGWLLALLWYWLQKGLAKILRLLAGFQVTIILLVISYAHFSDFILLATFNRTLLELKSAKSN